VDDRGALRVQVVGIVLVRNEDLHIEQAVQNVASFCDRIFAVDHISTDETWDILRRLSLELDHLDVRRARHTRESHRVLEPYVGTRTWVLRVDGDELYDPAGLVRLRSGLEGGEFDRAFRVQANVLHCVELDRERKLASGYMSPPSRPITSLFNLAATVSWKAGAERLEGGDVHFRAGYGWDSVDPLFERHSWEESPLRYLHVCFTRRSSLDPENSELPRLTLSETGAHRRGVVGTMTRVVRRPFVSQSIREVRARGSTWKLEKYRRGPLVMKDAAPFLPE
jgi:glycosyltransferase involved in cell wall biosynthesis